MKAKKWLSVLMTFVLMLMLTACGESQGVDINMDDVKNVMVNISGYLVAIGIALVLMIAVLIYAKKLKKPLKGLVRKSSVIAFLVALCICLNLILLGPVYSLVNLAFGEKISLPEELKTAGASLTEEIANEGIVLLKNNNLLPLSSETKKLNVFGWASVECVYGGTGSGTVDTSNAVTLLEGIASGGFETNAELSKFYTDYHVGRPLSSWAGLTDWTLSEPSPDQYPEDLLANAKAFSDTAVIVVARLGGENVDLPINMSKVDYNTTDAGQGHEGDFAADGHYLQLSGTERKLVEMVTADYKNVIVILNSANAMEMGWVDEYENIKGVIWCPGPGETGFRALGSILSGAVNPSGHLVDTFVYDLKKTPIWNNYGTTNYDNGDEFASGERAKKYFVNYVEGIYVGYKFYETAAEEGLIDYDEYVQYPFGYGLSYTDFSQKITDLQDDGNIVTITAEVKNTGSVAGKSVVELYYTPPYTNGGIEKASVNLAEFGKTKLLQPGESETITLSVKWEDIASYDYLGIKAKGGAYVLEKGEYVFSIRSDSHTVLDSKSVSRAKDVIYSDEKDGKRESDQATAVNLFDDVAGIGITYLSRKDSFANYEEATAKPNTVLDESYLDAARFMKNPDVKVLDVSSDVMPTTGAKNGLKITDLKGVAYSDAKWDKLLDQLTFDEMNTLIAYGGYSTAEISSIKLPATVECDGPQSIYSNYVDGVRGSAFPSAVMIAATWNQELAETRGDMMGQQADAMNISGWYGPAQNIHRSAFSGRNFEYYSEDGVMSGKIAAAEIRGANKYGLLTYMKHFALNDQEAGRQEIMTWSNEQAMREIYLKTFEICVKEGHSTACMNSYNCIGTTFAAVSEALNTKVLRGEWGFTGTIVTDWFNGGGYQNADLIIRGGADRMLSLTGNNATITDTSATSVLAMRDSVHHILYSVVNSRTGDHLETKTPAWVTTLTIIDVIAFAALALWEFLAIRKYLKAKKNG